jgi:rubrerythrin
MDQPISGECPHGVRTTAICHDCDNSDSIIDARHEHAKVVGPELMGLLAVERDPNKLYCKVCDLRVAETMDGVCPSCQATSSIADDIKVMAEALLHLVDDHDVDIKPGGMVDKAVKIARKYK